jgi:hypothetical protein
MWAAEKSFVTLLWAVDEFYSRSAQSDAPQASLR